MKIFNNPWFISSIFLVLGIFLGQMVPTRSLYSTTQYIKIWPSSLGGNDRLNLDNVITLKSIVPYNEQSITMLVGVVPIEEQPIKNKSFETEDTQVIHHEDSSKFNFNVFTQKTHQIHTNGRTFIVTLNKVRKIPLQNVSLALEYEFSISELSLLDKIINAMKQM